MTRLSPIEEIKALVAARYPVIWVVTWEEDRLEKALQEITRANNLDYQTWTYASGLKKGTAKPETLDPAEILGKIDELKSGTMTVLKDYHSFLKDSMVVRKLRDVSKQSDIYTPIVIVSPVLNIPIELEKLVAVVDYTLPTQEDIEQMTQSALEVLKDKPENIGEVVKACRGLTSDEIENVFAKSWAITGTLDPTVILSEKKQIIRKSGILDFYENLEDFANVGGMNNLKEWLVQRGKAFSSGAREFGLPTPKGLLLLGIPGTGKSLVCKTIAGLWGMPLLRLDIGRLMAGLVGSSEENMRKAIRLAEAVSPCILMIDEIEKGLSGVASSNYSDAGTTSRVVATLLQWMQDKTAPVFVVATANNVRELSPELLRKGRFDELFYIDLPSREERMEIVRIHLAKRGRDPEKFNIEAIATAAVGFSGSEIEEAIVSAMFDAYSFSKGEIDITTVDVIQAINATNPLSVIMKEKVTELREWCSTRARLASTNTAKDNKDNNPFLKPL